MAFIPDDALDRYDELQPASQIGYSFICRHRNHKNGIAPKSFDDCAAKYNWSRATKFNVQKELVEKKWVEKSGNGLKPLVGDFSPVSKSKNLDSQTEPESKFLDRNTPQKSKNLDNQSKKLDSESKNLDSHIRNNQPLPASNQKEELNNIVETSSTEVEKDSPELISFRKTLIAFQNDYAKPTTKSLAIANNVAVRKLFELARGDTRICVDAHLSLRAEEFRNGRVDWTTVLKNFTFYLANLKNGGTNGDGTIQRINGNGFESERQRRDREARQRIQFGEAADELLRREGII